MRQYFIYLEPLVPGSYHNYKTNLVQVVQSTLKLEAKVDEIY